MTWWTFREVVLTSEGPFSTVLVVLTSEGPFSTVLVVLTSEGPFSTYCVGCPYFRRSFLYCVISSGGKCPCNFALVAQSHCLSVFIEGHS